MSATAHRRSEKAAVAWRNMRVVGRLLAGRRWRLVALIALGLTASLAEGLSVGLLVELLYQFLGSPPAGGGNLSGVFANLLPRLGVPSLVAVVLLFVVVKTLISGIYTILAEQLSASVAHQVRAELYERFMWAPYAYITGSGTGALLSILEWEYQSVPETIGQMTSVMMDLCAIAIYATLILLISWKVAVGAVVLSGLLVLISLVVSSGAQARSERLRRSYEVLSEVTVSTIQAIRTLRLFSAESEAIERQQSASGGVARSAIVITKQESYRSPVRKIGLLLVGVAILAVLRFTGLTRELMLTVFAILYRTLPHVTSIEGQVAQLLRNSAMLQNTLSILVDQEREVNNPNHTGFDGHFRSIRFSDVGFAHGGALEPSLIDVNVSIGEGECIALTGPSGGGKTTLINLLGRLYEPTVGQVMVDERALSEIPPKEWLRTIAFAGQDVELISGSVFDNLRIGFPNLSAAEAWQALSMAQAASFVRSLGSGLDSRVGDRGTKLSGGQRQRLVLARALARHPRILILDEATNAVDPEMEQQIYRTIREERKALTILIITHRGDISLADRTLVVDRGRVRVAGRASENSDRAMAW